MLSWSINIYSKIDHVLVEGVLHLISIKERGHIWVEIISPYSGLVIQSHIRNGGSIAFRGEWVSLNDDSTGVDISTVLSFIYTQCKRFEDHKDTIGKMYFEYINSVEYEPYEMHEVMKRSLNGKIIELEEIMDLENPHDPYRKDLVELREKYDAISDMPPVPFVDEIQELFDIEGPRDFIVDLIRKFIDVHCDFQY